MKVMYCHEDNSIKFILKVMEWNSEIRYTHNYIPEGSLTTNIYKNYKVYKHATLVNVRSSLEGT